jgi:cytochrome c553
MDQLEAMEPHCRIAWFSATTTKSLDMKLLASLLMAAVLAAPAFPAFASGAAAPAKADLAKGEASYSTVCVACHAADGNSSIAENPKLAQQHPEYIVKQLQDSSPASAPALSCRALPPCCLTKT